MQSVNRQLHEMPMGDHFFPQQNQQHQQPPGIGPQLFSPQLMQARLQQHQQQQQQQGALVQDVHGMDKNPGLQNVYLLKQKLEAANAAFGPQQISQLQAQPQQLLNNGQNAMSSGLGAVSGVPPGVNIMQQNAPSLGPPPGTLAPHLVLGGSFALPPPNQFMVRDVWSNNLYAEFAQIRKLVDQYNVVSISTEFVGTIARPMGNFRSKNDYHYQTMRSNVDLLNPVQVGISISDARGNKPETGPSTWQFNFHFDVTQEMVSAESLELLKKSGVNFERHQNLGVTAFEFAQLVMDSGLVSDDVTWVSYHAAYDFGFLVNMLMNNAMPNNKEDYVWWVHQFMPSFYDLNLINKFAQQQQQQQNQTQGQPQQQQPTLEAMADDIGIPRFPLFSSTAGQSLLALLTFTHLLKLRVPHPQLGPDLARYKNMIYGITNE
ncbi:LANO_0A00496g1_1 [Lachancea nothofagi CBS 11611]|uniref:poly(A)-specific ribonuclease n=1 Tax=Lachancea nothofagi CBS 11611 TaxID=1266666 RepID=A0A1G4IM88_9SACH|nr:LANO_0A00496g1_1 [Lachancea nothofagi CBS 11611]